MLNPFIAEKQHPMFWSWKVVVTRKCEDTNPLLLFLGKTPWSEGMMLRSWGEEQGVKQKWGYRELMIEVWRCLSLKLITAGGSDPKFEDHGCSAETPAVVLSRLRLGPWATQLMWAQRGSQGGQSQGCCYRKGTGNRL